MKTIKGNVYRINPKYFDFFTSAGINAFKASGDKNLLCKCLRPANEPDAYNGRYSAIGKLYAVVEIIGHYKNLFGTMYYNEDNKGIQGALTDWLVPVMLDNVSIYKEIEGGN